MCMAKAIGWGVATALLAANAAAAPERIAQAGRWFVDPQGRAVLIHGGNVTLPDDPAGGAPTDRWSKATPARMADQGFNGVRLVVFLSAIMPRPGVIDTAYLDRIAATVAAYKDADVHVLIDFHQDEYSASIGVRGMPDWAVFTDGLTRKPGLEFPMGYFMDPAVQTAFNNFWANHPVPGTGEGVQDLYADALAAVAARFRDEPAVIGIDVMNEPATGSRCAQPDPVASNCPELQEQLLRPFYDRATHAIGTAAPHMIVFVEPFMLQGALGAPAIATPILAPQGRRALSFHNYGPVKATRDTVNDGALAHVVRSGAAIINTEWGFTNDPAEVDGQADDFDARLISWLAWTRGPFEALVDPSLPDRDNGNRVALLRAYARPFPQATAGTPRTLRYDQVSGRMDYEWLATLANGKRAGAALETEIRIPASAYPNGYRAAVEGGSVTSAANAPVLRIRNAKGAARVLLTLARVGDLPPLPASAAAPDRSEAALAALPPIPDAPLSRQSLIGHMVLTPGGREVLDRAVPGMLQGMSHVHGWEKLTLPGIRQFAPGMLTDAKLAEIDVALGQLKVTPGKPKAATDNRLSIDSLTSDLLADPRARAILDREAPGLADAPQKGLFPQTRLRNLQPAMPDRLSPAALDRIAKALAVLP
jgi:endoglycosylceramidase